MVSVIRILLVSIMVSTAFAALASEKQSMSSLINLIENHQKLQTYKALEPIEKIAREGIEKKGAYSGVEANAIYYLADQYSRGNGVQQNHDRAFELLSYITYQERTHLKAAFNLTAIYLHDENSKYFDLEAGLEILRLLSRNYKDSLGLKAHRQLLFALYNFGPKLPNQSAVEKEIEEVTLRAANQGDVAANWDLYLIRKKKFESNPNLVKLAIENLRFAAENQWPKEFTKKSQQARSARTLAIIYREGKLVERNDEQYRHYLEIGAKLDEPQSLFLLGKAYMNGVGGDVNEAKAKRNLIQARDLAEIHAPQPLLLIATLSQGLLDNFGKRASIEEEFNNFKPPVSWFENFVAAQAYSRSIQSNDDFVEQNGIYTANKSRKNISTYTYSGNTIRSADGTRWNITGDTIRGSNGQTYRRTGSTIRSSDGTRYTLSGNTMRGSDGTRYTFSGNSVRSSNGVRCKRVGSRVRCY